MGTDLYWADNPMGQSIMGLAGSFYRAVGQPEESHLHWSIGQADMMQDLLSPFLGPELDHDGVEYLDEVYDLTRHMGAPLPAERCAAIAEAMAGRSSPAPGPGEEDLLLPELWEEAKVFFAGAAKHGGMTRW